MALTIISGTPGSGKTAYVVGRLIDIIEREQRVVYVLGIPELSLPHIPCGPVKDWTEYKPIPEDPSVKAAHFTFPDGALIVIDEAQKVFRPRANSSAVPPHVAAFEHHRHKGLDFWLITQFPNLLDSNLRALCGCHIHLRASWSGRKLFEWPEAVNPASRSERGLAASRPYSLPKAAFGLYKSASLHIKPERRVPLVAFAFAALVVAGVVSIWFSAKLIKDKMRPPADSGEIVQADSSRVDRSNSDSIPAPSSVSASTSSPASPVGLNIADWTPRITTRPETAPLYDAIRQPKTMPIVAGCVDLRGHCKCVTQQGTDAFLTDDQCREWIVHPAFNPWIDPAESTRALPTNEKGGRGAAPGDTPADQVSRGDASA